MSEERTNKYGQKSFEPVESGNMTVLGRKLKYRIITGGYGGGYNGYVTFPKRPVREPGYNGLLNYVPVHGGITYANGNKDGSMEYGFDTAHYKSEEMPRTDVNWIKQQIRQMAKGIIIASDNEAGYLRCISNRGKAKYAQRVADVAPEEEIGFGGLINMMSGKL